VQKVACLVAISGGDLRSFQIWFFGVYFARSAVCGSGFFISAIPPKSVELKPQLQFVFYSIKKYVLKSIANYGKAIIFVVSFTKKRKTL